MAKFNHVFIETDDQHPEHLAFMSALHARTKLRLRFFSKEDGGILHRVCAPMDFGPSRRTEDPRNRYHFWDYESDTENHVLSLVRGQIQGFEILSAKFEPTEFVTWSTTTSPWYVLRDWARFS